MSSDGRRWRLPAAIVAAAGLVVDAYIHLDLASNYDPVATSTLSQGDLFRAEAAVAIVAALALLVRVRFYTAAAAFVVAASALAAVLVYRYQDIGSIGPIPSMYEPVWFTEKSIAAIAEAVSAVASASLLIRVKSRAAPVSV